MQITKKDPATIEVRQTISTEALAAYISKIVQHAQKELTLPGFRKGAAPEKMVRQHIGEQKLLHEAAEEAVKDTWVTALQQERVEPVGNPEVRITKLAEGNPLEFVIVASIIPPVTLPDYKTLVRALPASPPAEVTEEEVNQTIDYLKKNSAQEHTHDEEKLKSAIRENLQFEKNHKAKEARRIAMLECIATEVSLALPPLLVEEEIKRMEAELKQSLSNIGLSWEKYLEHVKKGEEEIKKDWPDQARKRVLFGLIMRAIAQAENLSPTEQQIEERIALTLRSLSDEERKKVSQDQLAGYLYGRVQNENVFAFLEELAG